jgi:hypothetical protein
MSGFEVARLGELARIPVAEGLEWRPVRRRFGIGAFGVNAYTSARVGGWVVERHTEGSGHQELCHLACLEARAGWADDARAHLARALELPPAWTERARRDDDLRGIL